MVAFLRSSGLLAFGWLCAFSACLDAPEVAVVTDHFEIAPDFDHRICAGTLDALESQLEFVETALWPTLPTNERIQFYWITRNIEDWCGDGRLGCFWPGTRVLVGDAGSVMHEIVHVVIDAPAGANMFVEEAIAELYSGVGVYHRPSTSSRATPSEQIGMDRDAYREGGLDYLVARHFLNFVHARHGKRGVRTLARAVESGESPEQIRHIFETMFGTEFELIEEKYLQSSRRYYAGIREYAVARVGETGTTTTVDLDCDAEGTRGPLFNGGAGMYKTMRYDAVGETVLEVSVKGPPGSFVLILAAPSRHMQIDSLDYEYPRGGTTLHSFSAGDPSERIRLESGTYVFAYMTGGYEPATLKLETRVLSIVP